MNVQGAAIQPRTVPLWTCKIAPRASPGASKTQPCGHPGSLTCIQEAPEPSRKDPKDAQECPRGSPEAAKSRPWAPKDGQERSRGGHGLPKSAQDVPAEAFPHDSGIPRLSAKRSEAHTKSGFDRTGSRSTETRPKAAPSARSGPLERTKSMQLGSLEPPQASFVDPTELARAPSCEPR